MQTKSFENQNLELPFEIKAQEFICLVEESRDVNIVLRASIDEAHGHKADIGKAALVVLIFLDNDENVILPSTELPISPNLGTYRYLNVSEDGSAETSITVRIPKNATKLKIQFRSWRSEIPVRLLDISIAQQNHDSATPIKLLENLLSKGNPSRPIFIIYTTAPQMGHPSITLRSNRFALGFAKQGALVLFFPFGGANQNNMQYGDGIIQFQRTYLSEVLDVVSAARMNNVTFICSAFSDHQAVCAIDYARICGWKTVYECRDDMEEFRRSGYAKWHYPRLEMRAVDMSSTVTAVSPRLQQKMRELSKRKRVVHLIPNGVSDDFLAKSKHARSLSVLSSRSKMKVVGYIGHLTSSWFDWPLVIRAAAAAPDLEFQLIGFGEPKNLELPENVKLLGPKTHDEFISISKEWGVGIIPFIPSKLTYGVDPNKLYEYLALALPVVSAPMGGVTESPMTKVYYSTTDFLPLLQKSLETNYSLRDLEELEAYLESCRWPNRITAATKLIEAMQ